MKKEKENKKNKKKDAIWNLGLSDAEDEEERFIEEMEMMDLLMEDEDWLDF